MTEKRVLIAAMLSALFLALYSHFLTKKLPVKTSNIDIVSKATPNAQPRQQETQLIEKEDVVVISSGEIEVEVGKLSGSIRKVALKNFKDELKLNPVSFGGETLPVLAISSEDLVWNLADQSETKVSFDVTDKSKNIYKVSYAVDWQNPIIDLAIVQKSGNSKEEQVTIYSNWFSSTKIKDRYNNMEGTALYQNSNGKQLHKRFLWNRKRLLDVPRGTSLLSLSERYFCQSIEFKSGSIISQSILPSEEWVLSSKTDINLPKTGNVSMKIYFGPRDYFYLKKAGMELAFPIGIIEKIGLVLLWFLNLIANSTRNYGIGIVIFSIFITFMTAPFTLMNFKSMKKLRQLKPEVDKLMAQYKDDQARASKEVFALYKENKVSPLSGCLPILFQIPIFIALFKAISHFVQLRGKSFLWIADLSLPDRFLHIPFSAPIIGNYINVLPIITAVVMYMQTKMSSAGMEADTQNPSANIASSPLMAVLFGLMFYNISSGLVLYWMTNSAMSVLLFKLSK